MTLTEEEFEGYHKKAFDRVQKEIEIDGFRKGNAPEDMIVKRYGDMIILEEMGNLAISDAYMKAVDEHTISPVAQPSVTITKIARGNPFEVTITVPVLPEVKLPDYKKIKKAHEKGGAVEEVTDKDVESVLEELRKGRAGHGHAHDDHDHAHEGRDHAHDGHDHKHHDHEGHDHTHDHGDAPAIELPPLDDAFAQSFGDTFKTLDDLKKKVSENLTLEKKQKASEKHRMAVMEAIMQETTVDVPDALIESELASMMAQFKGDITRFGGTWEEYLAHAKKTEDEIKATWKDDARKRALSQLILHKIGEVEKLHATEAEVEVELIRLLAQVQDADEERAKAYLHQALSNDKVLRFLTSGDEETGK